MKKAKVTFTGEREMRVERIFDATRERVWAAYTQADLIRQWWARGNDMVVETFDCVRGGHWRFVERAPDGNHGFEGRFAEVQAMDLLSYTFEWDGAPGHAVLETLRFEDLGDGRTKLVATSLFMTAADLDGMKGAGMEEGMHQSYEALDRLLERTR